MLTRLAIHNFKLFDKVELEFGDRVVPPLSGYLSSTELESRGANRSNP